MCVMLETELARKHVQIARKRWHGAESEQEYSTDHADASGTMAGVLLQGEQSLLM